MNKIALLTLVLLVALPGCGNGNKQSAQPVKKNNVAKYIDTPDDEEIVEEIVEEDEDVANMLNFEDEDEEEDGEEAPEDEEEDSEEADEDDTDLSDLERINFEDEEDEEEDGDQMGFRWIDAQTDDELKP